MADIDSKTQQIKNQLRKIDSQFQIVEKRREQNLREQQRTDKEITQLEGKENQSEAKKWKDQLELEEEALKNLTQNLEAKEKESEEQNIKIKKLET